MKIGYISLVSEIHDPEIIRRTSDQILIKLKENFDFEEIEASEISEVDIPIVFVKTGGTENEFINIAKLFKDAEKPVTLLSCDCNNSLPASLEILSWSNLNGFKNSAIIHGPIETIKVELKKRINDIKLIEELKKTKIGVIGKPSDWLIASNVDYKIVKEKWGVSIKDIGIEELLENIKNVHQNEIIELLPKYSDSSLYNGIGLKDIKEALKIYVGLKKLISDHNLSAFTLRCFDLLEPLHSTGCLALAILNDEGIPSGCEGDIPALFTMLINNLITDEPSFMANPSLIHDDIITFAHCTVPLSIVDTFTFKTHFETDKGVGIAGNFSDGWITLSKIGGSALDHFYIDEGAFIEKSSSKKLCRTQITIAPNNNMDYFLKNPLGNHHIISKGKNMKRMKEVMQLFEVSSVTN